MGFRVFSCVLGVDLLVAGCGDCLSSTLPFRLDSRRNANRKNYYDAPTLNSSLLPRRPLAPSARAALSRRLSLPSSLPLLTGKHRNHPTRKGWKGAYLLVLRGTTTSTPSGGKPLSPPSSFSLLFAAHTDILVPLSLPRTDILVSLSLFEVLLCTGGRSFSSGVLRPSPSV